MYTRNAAFSLFLLLIWFLCLSAPAEIGVHWWPCATLRIPRAETKLFSFNGRLWSVAGFYQVDPDFEVYYWAVDTTVVYFDDCTNFRGSSRLVPDFYPDATRCIIHDESIFVFSQRYWSRQPCLFTSADGFSWDFSTIPTGVRGPFISFADYIWSYTCNEGIPGIQRSSDGWEWITVEPTGDFVCNPILLEFQGKLFSIGSDSTRTRESLDGVTWFPVLQGDYVYEDLRIHGAVVLNEYIWLFAGLREHSGGRLLQRVYRSSDAINWHLINDGIRSVFPADGNLYGFATWRDRIWILGGNVGFILEPFRLFYTEDTPPDIHRADYDGDGAVSLSELLRGIQLYQAGRYRCDGTTEDTYAPGAGWETCVPHNSDYNPQDWRISLGEILRLIQFYNSGGYHACPEEGTEDGFCPGAG